MIIYNPLARKDADGFNSSLEGINQKKLAEVLKEGTTVKIASLGHDGIVLLMIPKNTSVKFKTI